MTSWNDNALYINNVSQGLGPPQYKKKVVFSRQCSCMTQDNKYLQCPLLDIVQHYGESM
jgi:hypothetical protein